MQESTEIPRPGFVKFNMTMKPGQNIARRGEDAAAGAVVIPACTPITPAEIGVLAAVGCHQVPVRRKPTIAILGTGDELVEPHETPGPAQIRNSNSHQLVAQCAAKYLQAKYLGVARDDRALTRKMI
jgi:molybdopterin molybdotransferase